MFRSQRRRALIAGAGISLVTALAFAPVASAFDCFKWNFTDGAYAAALKSGHYTSIAQMSEEFVVADVAPSCLGKLDYNVVLAGWMQQHGANHIPLVYTPSLPDQAIKAYANPKGNSGPGLHGSGKESNAYGYLETYIPELTGLVMAGLQDLVSQGECTFAP